MGAKTAAGSARFQHIPVTNAVRNAAIKMLFVMQSQETERNTRGALQINARGGSPPQMDLQFFRFYGMIKENVKKV